MIEKAIYALLTNDATIQGYIGTRVFPWPIPQGAIEPSVCYMVDEKPIQYCDNGNGIIYNEVAIAVLSESLLTAETIGVEIKRVLNFFRGTAGGVVVHHIRLMNGENDFDEEARMHFVKQVYQMTILTN